MIKKEDLEKSTRKILAQIKGKKLEDATKAIEQFKADLMTNVEELEDALAASRKAMKDVELMSKFIDKSTTLEANGAAAGNSVRDQLKELNPKVNLGVASFIADRARETFGNRQKPKIVPEEG